VGGAGRGGDTDTPRLMAGAMTMARQIAALPRSGVEGYKRIMADGLGTSFTQES